MRQKDLCFEDPSSLVIFFFFVLVVIFIFKTPLVKTDKEYFKFDVDLTKIRKDEQKYQTNNLGRTGP